MIIYIVHIWFPRISRELSCSLHFISWLVLGFLAMCSLGFPVVLELFSLEFPASLPICFHSQDSLHNVPSNSQYRIPLMFCSKIPRISYNMFPDYSQNSLNYVSRNSQDSLNYVLWHYRFSLNCFLWNSQNSLQYVSWLFPGFLELCSLEFPGFHVCNRLPEYSKDSLNFVLWNSLESP